MDRMFLPLNKEDFKVKELKSGTILVLPKKTSSSIDLIFSEICISEKIAIIISPRIVNFRKINHIPQALLLKDILQIPDNMINDISVISGYYNKKDNILTFKTAQGKNTDKLKQEIREVIVFLKKPELKIIKERLKIKTQKIRLPKAKHL